jgi:hypothetical protein
VCPHVNKLTEGNYNPARNPESNCNERNLQELENLSKNMRRIRLQIFLLGENNATNCHLAGSKSRQA